MIVQLKNAADTTLLLEGSSRNHLLCLTKSELRCGQTELNGLSVSYTATHLL